VLAYFQLDRTPSGIMGAPDMERRACARQSAAAGAAGESLRTDSDGVPAAGEP